MPPALPIRATPALYEAVCRFIDDNTQFESSHANKVVCSAIGDSCDINEAALAPLKHQVFGFSEALRWGFFLQMAAAKAAEKSSTPLKFHLEAYYEEVARLYDLAVDENVWAYCDGSDDDTSSE